MFAPKSNLATGTDTTHNSRPVGRPQAGKPSLSPIAHGKLSPEDVVEDDARVYTDSLNLIPVITDHDEQGSPRKAVSTGAIRIHFVCAGCGHRDYVAIYAKGCGRRNTATSVEGIRTHTDEWAGYGRGG